MSLCKPRTVSPARIEANRRHAQKSTGPRSVRGKAQSRMNELREGGCGKGQMSLVVLSWKQGCQVANLSANFMAERQNRKISKMKSAPNKLLKTKGKL
jgi:hypothetical protein